MSAEPPIGSFFAVSLEEIHEIAEKSGNADCILAMIALRRGQGKKKNTGWGRLSIKKHMALPHSRANYAIDWLLENRYFIEGKREVKSKGKSLGEDQSGAKGKEHLFPVRSLPPTTLRSRFREFVIKISKNQMKDIAVSITHDLIDELPDTEVVFHPSAIEKLSDLESPRIMKKYAEDALGRTLLGGRDIVEPKDIKTIVHAKPKMGFL